MDRNEAHRRVADRLALYGTCADAGGKADGPEPIDIIERVVEGLPPDKAYSLGQVLRHCLRAGKEGDMDVELGKANDYAHRLVFGHWRSRGRHTL